MSSDDRKFNLTPQERDLDLLHGLLVSRLMTLAHIAVLYFDCKGEAAKKRVQKLKAAKLIGEHRKQPRDPSILFLTKKGYRLLCDKGRLEDEMRVGETSIEKRARVRDTTIWHELEVMDVKAAVYAAVRNTNHLAITEFNTWPKFYEFPARCPSDERIVTVQPDGFIQIAEAAGSDEYIPHTFFLEVDRSSETLARVVRWSSAIDNIMAAVASRFATVRRERNSRTFHFAS